MKRGFIFVVALLWWAGMGARAEEKESTKGWERSLALGVTTTAGNKDSLLFTGSVVGQRAWEKDDWRLGAEGAYGKVEDSVSTAKARLFGQYKRLFTERWYGTLLLEGLHDSVADITYRITTAVGLGYYFIKSDRTKLSADIGPAFVYEKQESETGEGHAGVRLGERLDRKLSDSAKCWQSLEVVPQVNEWDNFTALFEVGVEAALTKDFSVRLVGQDQYDNQPSAGKKRNDVTVIGSLVYKF